MHWYLKVIKENYANFSGRARRKEYWMFVLVQIIISILVLSYASLVDDFFDTPIVGSVLGIYFLATLVPWLALNVRRLHDIGKSGTYIFINFIPVIGRIWYIVLVATEGEYGLNNYGPDPKGEAFDEIDDIGQLEE
ncbi:DUF805 domain-containing protein [Psychroserpens luteus]|uniref:DUF805 domain-containing protein n=1 Tax=Psychroserpens luteus TaxID=1434066 RepID=A0ABW5ZTG7_9FLAO|nr:DUF805 domain-containing protein [Psychroserpens luteus]|tara:strand:+ start:58 stop:465 length:408 start_codon:yes stop_codon:yes gene_type:complete